MKEMTERQRSILEFIKSFSSTHGVPPTVREIGDQFSVTPRAAFDHLKALERKGELQRRASAGRTSRSLTVPGTGRAQPYRLPILGRVAAGQPLLAVENREGELEIAAASLPGRGEDLFALRVRGDSMIDAHICDGDLVLVRRQDTAHINDIVVAIVGSGDDAEATVKRYQRDGDRVVLRPAHPTMAPIVVDPGKRELKIIGKVVGLLRGF
jgi:repressor LexA